MFYFIGLGLADERDITVRGLDIVRRAARVYLEAYTSILLVDKAKLEAFYGRAVIVADREMVESHSDDILRGADTDDVAFLVVGDPFGATTHSDLASRCASHTPRIPVRAVHNATILSAVGATGLSLYEFGATTSMVFFLESWRPDSFYDRLAANAAAGAHALVLLDIKVKEPDLDLLAREGRLRYEPPRFMAASLCAAQMLETEGRRGEGVCAGERLAVAVARMGADDQLIKCGTLAELSEYDMGPPLHSVILVGRRCNEVEREMIRGHAIDVETFDKAWAAGGYGKHGS